MLGIPNASAVQFTAKAYQGNKQFPTTYSFNPDYEEIESEIPMGIREDGVVTFEPLDPSMPSEFRFTAEKGIYEWVISTL
jgi:hypothetical protein